MVDLLKKLLPTTFKDWLRPFKMTLVDNPKKRKLFLHMQKKHQELLQQIKGKETIKVVFLAIHKSVWKVDPVFQKMLTDPFFEPVILVCPYTVYGEERMWQDMQECYEYFKEKGYPLLSSYNKEEQCWITLEEIQPDIVFFTNPHDLTRKEYYEDAYLNYLSCYVPYHHEVGSYGNNIDQYDQYFHNAMMIIFSSHNASYKLFKKTAQSKAANVIVTGYPAMEELLDLKEKKVVSEVWKNNDTRQKVIWAPHHTIDDPVLPYSNFLKYADKFKKLALSKAEDITWCFKPHPILKSKLYLHPEWGVKRTDEFYDFWRDNEFSQLSEGPYYNLFAESNFMIHDSGSFLAEYLYLEKPVMYLLHDNNHGNYYSEFGQAALAACEIGYSFDDVIKFVDKQLNNGCEINSEHRLFVNNNILPYFKLKPSQHIVDIIKDKVKSV